MLKNFLLFIIITSWALLSIHAISVNNVKYPYPIEASWFADRYTLDSWNKALDQFQLQGGHIIW